MDSCINERITSKKEVQTSAVAVQTNLEIPKMFRSIGTQTENFTTKSTNLSHHQDNINTLLQFQDHNYTTLSFNANHSAGQDKIQELHETEGNNGENRNEEMVEADGLCDNENDGDESFDDNGSMYSPSNSEDDSDSDDEKMGDDTPTKEKKFIVFESKLKELFNLCQKCGGPVESTNQRTQGEYGHYYQYLFKRPHGFLGVTTNNQWYCCWKSSYTSCHSLQWEHIQTHS